MIVETTVVNAGSQFFWERFGGVVKKDNSC